MNLSNFSILILLFAISQQFSISDAAGCSTHQFECANKNCVPLSWTCDGEDDCGDGSDENTDCKENITCSPGEFRCLGDGRCIPARWQCDGELDCEDKSDESVELCVDRTCGPEEWTCRSNNGQCIPLTWVCDDHSDCDDKSDEEVCNQTCTPDEFTCDNGKCIQNRWLCDKEDDCGDMSDEKKCPEHKCDSDNEFSCGDGYCITSRWRCDGDVDCPDASDEMECAELRTNATYVECTENEFRCMNRFYCVHNTWLCDGDTDCPDGSDESAQECGTKQECRTDQFRCNNGECIPGHLQCSGQPECKDGSDERNCPGKPTKVCDPKTEFDCSGHSSKMCISLDKVCDGRNDCGNWQDEPRDFCGVNECSTSHNVDGLKNQTLQVGGGCEQQCVDLPIGYMCACKDGYQLVGNKSCHDIDECQIPGKCSQMCLNRPGSFKCDCFSGYIKDTHDKTRCRAAEGHASLLFAHKSDIRKISLDRKGDTVTIVNNTRSSCAVDFNFRTGMVFWSDVMTQKIYKAPIDEGDKKKIVIDQNIVTADGLAVDWIYSHLYWTDTGTNSIAMSDLEGNLITNVIQDDMQEPRAIALHPEKGWMFWSDWGENPKIERAGMDGSHRSVIISETVRWPNGLTLDLVMDKVYWIDAKLNLVGSADLDGSNSRVVFYSPDMLKHPFSITLFEDWMYWSDWDRNAIFKADKFTGKNAQAVTSTHLKQIPMVVHVYHPYRQPEGTNFCLPLNGRCSHICVPAPQLTQNSAKTSCLCPHGLKLDEDSLNCVTDELYVRPTYSNVTKQLHSIILKKKEKLKKNQSQLEASNKFDDLENPILMKFDEKNVLEKENREMAVLAEDERLKEKLLKYAAEIEAEEKKDLKDDWNGFGKSVKHDVDDVDGDVVANDGVEADNGVPNDEVAADEVAADVENVTVNETENYKSGTRHHTSPSSSSSTLRSRGGSKVKGRDDNDGLLAGIIIGACTGAFLLMALLGIALYRKFWFKTLQNINFDNPVYRKTTEEAVSMERGTNGLLSSSETTSSIGSTNNSTSTTRTFTSTTLVTDASEEVTPLNRPSSTDEVV